MAPYVWVRRIAGHGIAQAKPMPQPRRAVVALVRRQAPALLRGVDLLAPRGMSPFCDTEEGGQTLRGQGLDGGSSRTQAVGGAKALEGGLGVAGRERVWRRCGHHRFSRGRLAAQRAQASAA